LIFLPPRSFSKFSSLPNYFSEPRIENHGLENLKKKIHMDPLVSGCPVSFPSIGRAEQLCMFLLALAISSLRLVPVVVGLYLTLTYATLAFSLPLIHYSSSSKL
jgi:hypothetical protein